MTPAPQKELKSYTGTYVMYISEGNVVITGREKFKSFKALFPIGEVGGLICSSSATSAERVLDIRPAVMCFAEAMERVLRKHDGKKTGWLDCDYFWLMDRAGEELKEAHNTYHEKWGKSGFQTQEEDAAEEMVDVANFCMMFYDKAHPELRAQRGERERER